MEELIEKCNKVVARCLCNDLNLGMRYASWGKLTADEKEEYLEDADLILTKAIPLISTEIKNWGDEDCPHHALTRHTDKPLNSKRKCDICWQALFEKWVK